MRFNILASTLSLVITAFAAPVVDIDTSSAALEKRVDSSVYNELKFYFQYASSAYSSVCLFPNGNTLVQQINNLLTDTQGFVARDDTRKEIIIALRGTWSIQDAFTDLGIVQVKLVSPGVSAPSNVYVHSGFLTAWNSIASTVISKVQAEYTAHPTYAIVATGHSLGGALSSLAAVSMKANFPSANVRMYTYGQPRTGNDDWAYWVNSLFGEDAKRAVNTNDGIPTILPTLAGYRHHGVEYWTKGFPATAANTVKCAADGEDPTCSASIPSLGLDPAHTTYYNTLAIVPYCI